MSRLIIAQIKEAIYLIIHFQLPLYSCNNVKSGQELSEHNITVKVTFKGKTGDPSQEERSPSRETFMRGLSNKRKVKF